MPEFLSLPDSVIPSLVGSLVGGACTLAGVMFSNLLDAQKRKRADRAGVQRLKNAICAEMKAILARHLLVSGRRLAVLSAEKPQLSKQHIEENYFIVFEQNANKLGDITDETLREQIISTYVLMKGFVDSVRHNNSLVEGYHEFEAKYRTDATPYDRERREFYKKNLELYSTLLGETARNMQASLEKTIAMLEGRA